MAAPRNRSHIFIVAAPATEPFTPHPRKIPTRPFQRPSDRIAHAAVLTANLRAAQAEATARRQASAFHVGGAEPGLYVQFEAPPGVVLKLDSLDVKKRGISLVAVQHTSGVDGSGDVEAATVFVPDGGLPHFLSRLNQYATEETPKGKPKHRDLVDRISSIRLATLRALWTDAGDAYPSESESIWWEVWLLRSDGSEVLRLQDFSVESHIPMGGRSIVFDDRIVCLVSASPAQLSPALDVLSDVAELRRARTGSSFFVDLSVSEQGEWVADLLSRTEQIPADAPAVCVLDTGVNRGHPLLEPAISEADATAVDPRWGSQDNGGGPLSAGHGTEMAGLALYGDLIPVLESSDPVRLRHRLESVKILPPSWAAPNEPDLYGAVTAQAVARPEIQAPLRPRVFSMAVTVPDGASKGQPTSWSAALDALAAGRGFHQSDSGLVYLDAAEAAAHRLFVVSAGNVRLDRFVLDHLNRSDLEPVQDPAHAWNALTVGACTNKPIIEGPDGDGWQPVARPGDLSPWSTTGVTFGKAWPNKPDVVFEGGNVAHDGSGEFDPGVPDLCLLSTYHQPIVKPLVISCGTSAATAQVARMGAIIITEHSALWPETVRALIVHSARWTSGMQLAIDGADCKNARGKLVQRYGFGVPDVSRALRSALDSLTLVAESTIHPYENGKMREMHTHQLPWPTEALEQLGERNVQLRVTLSYFIEPNPGRLGWRSRHRYASHGLRFDVKTATESLDAFRKRLNKKALDEDEGKPTGGSDSSEWLLGDRMRHRGSIHTDIWTGSAADLASRSVIGVYPVSGWWKEQPKRDGSSVGARYSLIVSIETDAEDVDIWTPVANQVGIPITTSVVEL